LALDAPNPVYTVANETCENGVVRPIESSYVHPPVQPLGKSDDVSSPPTTTRATRKSKIKL